MKERYGQRDDRRPITVEPTGPCVRCGSTFTKDQRTILHDALGHDNGPHHHYHAGVCLRHGWTPLEGFEPPCCSKCRSYWRHRQEVGP